MARMNCRGESKELFGLPFRTLRENPRISVFIRVSQF